MAREAELVEEFRGIVDGVIRRQVEDCQGADGRIRRSWPGYDKTAKAAGLIFTSLARGDARYSHFPFSGDNEHLWGVSPDSKYKIGKFTGHVSVSSFTNTPDQLVRNWSFDSAMQLINPSSRRILTEVDELEDALKWAKSPHLFPESFDRLAMLSSEEIAVIDPQLDDISNEADKLSKGLASLAQQRYRPIPHLPIA